MFAVGSLIALQHFGYLTNACQWHVCEAHPAKLLLGPVVPRRPKRGPLSLEHLTRPPGTLGATEVIGLNFLAKDSSPLGSSKSGRDSTTAAGTSVEAYTPSPGIPDVEVWPQRIPRGLERFKVAFSRYNVVGKDALSVLWPFN